MTAGSPQPTPAVPDDPGGARQADPAAPADLFADLSSPALRAAAGRVWDAHPHELSGPERAGELIRLARAIEAGGEEPGLLPLPPAELPRLWWLLCELQAEMVREWSSRSSPPPAGEMLSLLRSFDRLRGALEPPAPGPASGPGLAVELAHDLRSPLTSILFLSELLRNGQSGPVTALQHRQLGIIYSAALGLVSLAGDIIEMSNANDLLVEAERTEFSVSEMLGSIGDMVRPMAEHRRLELRFQCALEGRRRGFPVALSRVLLNLTINALKFTDEGSVEVGVRPTGATTAEFWVRDTGRGLDEEALRQLRRPLRSPAPGGRLGFSGSGLGLAICRRLLGALNSELRCETASGRGTRFFFEVELPVEERG